MTRRLVLVVDSNAAHLALMQYLLRACGDTVFTAKTGEEALAVATANLPDVILIDLQLPTMSGFDTLTRLREMKALAAVTIIAMTSLAVVGDRDTALRHGFDGYISKPITPDTFVAQLEAFIDRRANHDRLNG